MTRRRAVYKGHSTCIFGRIGAQVAQWVKRWPTDLEVPGSILARGEIFSTVNGVPLHTGRAA